MPINYILLTLHKMTTYLSILIFIAAIDTAIIPTYDLMGAYQLTNVIDRLQKYKRYNLIFVVVVFLIKPDKNCNNR